MPTYLINPGKPKRKGKLRGAAKKAFLARMASGRAKARRPAKPNPKRRSSMPKKRRRRKLTGAAKAAFLKRMAKGRNKVKARRRKARKNPARYSTPAYRAGWERTFGKGKKKRRKKTSKKVARRRKKRTVAAKTARTGGTMAKRKRRKSSKRSRAAKKAARTRAAKKAARRAAAKKGARKRRRRGAVRHAAPRRRKRRGGVRRVSARKRRRYASRRRRGVGRPRRDRRRQYYLARARGNIKYARKRGSTRAKWYLRKHRMRSNPLGAIVDTVKAVVPIAAGFYLSRLAANKIPSLPYVGQHVAKLGRHAGPAVAAGLMLLTHFGTKFLGGKVAIVGKYRTQLLMGTGLALVDSLIATYAPAEVKGYIAAPVGDVYDDALMSAGEYVDTGDYVETSDYVDTGAEFEELGSAEELAAYQDLAAAPGGVASSVRAPQALIPSVPSVAVVPAVASQRAIPHWGNDPDEAFYTGVFARSQYRF